MGADGATNGLVQVYSRVRFGQANSSSFEKSKQIDRRLLMEFNPDNTYPLK